MANGPRSIYSRRQRLGPARYDNPLADFLDNLPGYINQFQQNQLALERQQLAEKRYEEDRAYRKRQEERAVEQQNIENLKYVEQQKQRVAREKARQLEKLEDRKREDDNAIRRTGDSFLANEQYDQALKIYESIGDVSAMDTVRSLSTQKNDLEDRFVAVRSKIGNREISPVEIKDELISINKDFDIDPLSQIGKQLYSIEQLNNKEINRINKGFVPPQEWESMFGASGRMDYNALVNAEKNLQDLAKEQASPSAAITSGIGGATLEERIEAEQKTIQEILNQPKYKLETEAEYRARKEFNKTPFGALLPRGETQESFYASSAFPTVEPTEENLAQINDEVSKNLDKVFSDPKEPYEVGAMEPATEAVPGLSDQEKRELGMPMINLPSATAGQQGDSAPAPVDTTLKLGENISAPIQEAGSFDVKSISEASNYLKNPLTGRRYAKDLNKLNNLMNRMREADNSPNPDFTKKQIQKGIDKISNKIKKAYGEFIDPNTGNFTDESFTDEFYSNLATPSGISKERLKQIFKALSTAPQSKTEV
jgi:hypothetical protein|tara:strand:- start:4004 stop:5623 length:1620 start_codon:yes stop_codon:yes gene_type:complete